MPRVDIDDQVACMAGEAKRHWFSAENANFAYMEALEREECVKKLSGDIGSADEKEYSSAVKVIVYLHKAKKYRHETYFIAVGLFTRFLNRTGPEMEISLNMLAIVSLLIAAKINESLSPSISKTIELLQTEIKDEGDLKRKIIETESRVLTTLHFDVQVTSSYVFMGRFLTVFCRHVDPKAVHVLEYTAFQFLKFMTYQARFLNFKLSHQAAAACILLVNLYSSQAAIATGLIKTAEQVTKLSEQFKKVVNFDQSDPLAIWDATMEDLFLIRAEDLRDVYDLLVRKLSEREFRNKLASFPHLWLNR